MLKRLFVAAFAGLAGLMPGLAQAELLAMANYESAPGETARKEGIAVLDIDPGSPTYKQILVDMPLPPDLIAHHVFYNPEVTKAYVTALGKSELRVMDMTRYPYRTKVVAVPGCEVLEDVAFSRKLGRWYLTCMGTSNVVVGDAETDEVIDSIAMPKPWPHGISVRDDIDRIIVTSTVKPDLTAAGEHVIVLRASTNEVLSVHKTSSKPSPSGAAPVEVFFVPGTNPPVAYITNMNEGTLWTATWQPETETFAFAQVEDVTRLGQGMPLEVYFNEAGDRAFVTTAKPGHLNVYDISDPAAPRHLTAVPTAAGAHHLVFSADGRYAFVQNSLLNLEGLSDGSISVVDLQTGAKVDSIDTFKEAGLRPNMIVLLPEFGGSHTH